MITQETRDKMSPEDILQAFKNGNERFLAGKLKVRKFTTEVTASSSGQYPVAIVLSCIDSRLPIVTIFDLGIGDVFNCKIAGNILNDDIIGSMEFAVDIIGVKMILVMGHTKCGAVKGACQNVQHGKLTQLLNKFKPVIERVKAKNQIEPDPVSEAYFDAVAKENVLYVMEEIKKESSTIAKSEKDDKVLIAGCMYDVNNGQVSFFD